MATVSVTFMVISLPAVWCSVFAFSTVRCTREVEALQVFSEYVVHELIVVLWEPVLW